jgi:hypothetical protein
MAALKMSTAVKLRRQRKWQQRHSLVLFNVFGSHHKAQPDKLSELRNQKTPIVWKNALPIFGPKLWICYDELKAHSCYFRLIREIIVGCSFNKVHIIKA